MISKTNQQLEMELRQIVLDNRHLLEKQRLTKMALLKLMERVPVPNTTKQKIGDELFLIYQGIK